MRLHEIADPNDYNLPDTESIDIAKQVERTQPDHRPDNAKPRPRTPLKTKTPLLPETK